jgi:hypothetical protein
MKRSMCGAWIALLLPSCGGPQQNVTPTGATGAQGALAPSVATPQIALSATFTGRNLGPNVPTPAGVGPAVALGSCSNNAPFITAINWGAPTAQGYPVEIAGFACPNDSIVVQVGGPNLALGLPPSAPGDVGVTQQNGTFDRRFFYTGRCGTGSVFFEISTTGNARVALREVDLNYTRGISCLGAIP